MCSNNLRRQLILPCNSNILQINLNEEDCIITIDKFKGCSSFSSIGTHRPFNSIDFFKAEALILYLEANCASSLASKFISLGKCRMTTLSNSSSNRRVSDKYLIKFPLIHLYSFDTYLITNCEFTIISTFLIPFSINISNPKIKASHSASLLEQSLSSSKRNLVSSSIGCTSRIPTSAPFWWLEPRFYLD